MISNINCLQKKKYKPKQIKKMSLKTKKEKETQGAENSQKAEAQTQVEAINEAVKEFTDLNFEEVEEMADFDFFQLKEKGDVFTGWLIEDCADSENPTFSKFEGIVAETYPEKKKVVLSRHYNVLKFMNEGHYKGGVCRITLLDRVQAAKGTVCKFKFEQAN